MLEPREIKGITDHRPSLYDSIISTMKQLFNGQCNSVKLILFTAFMLTLGHHIEASLISGKCINIV